ncbi:MAG: hypothetical protein ACTSYX_02080 [Candidatus Thorarchaeota archaeon]
MVKEIIVLRNSGIPLFHYSVTGERRVDDIVAAFLSAIGSLAEEAGEQQLRVISFASNKFVWTKKGDIYMIALVSAEDSTRIYRVILQELIERFVGQYYEELRDTDSDGVGALGSRFQGFADTIESVLHKFDGIPGLARRYKTLLLNSDIVNKLKLLLSQTEDNGILRGAGLTLDGHVIVSNLRAYEMEIVLDMLDTISKQDCNPEEPLRIVHTSLDPGTAFDMYRGSDRLCAFVVDSRSNRIGLVEKARTFVEAVNRIDISRVPRLEPLRGDGDVAFHELDIIVPTMTRPEHVDSVRTMLAGVESEIQHDAITILEHVRRKTLLHDVLQATGLEMGPASEALAVLISRGLVRVSRAYPVLREWDERFIAYLEVIGMPKKDYDILNRVWEHCDGSKSVSEIAALTNVPATKIMEVLRRLGTHVQWKTQ